MRYVRYTTRHVKTVIALYKSGLGAHAIMQQLAEIFAGPPPSTTWICRIVVAAGIKRTRSRAQELRWNRQSGRDLDALRAEAKQLATEKDLSPCEVGAVLGVSPNFARKYTRAARRRRAVELGDAAPVATGGSMRAFAFFRRAWMADTPEVHARRERVARCAELYLDGRTYREISEATGAPVGSITNHLKAAGLVPSRLSRRRR